MDKTTDEKLQSLQSQVDNLSKELYRNNFSGRQDFNKIVQFNTKLIIPKYGSLPVVCDENELVAINGILYLGLSNNRWSLVGNQS